jgi:outer membrane murein-binding lipoprotein Lpp
MKPVRLCAAVTLLALMPVFSFAADEAGGVKPETTALYQKARDQVTKLNNTPVTRYAPEVVEQAAASIEAAQNGLQKGNDRATRQASELATTQVKLALALTDERIAAEKTAAAQKELAQLEQRLEAILAGKGEKP